MRCRPHAQRLHRRSRRVVSHLRRRRRARARELGSPAVARRTDDTRSSWICSIAVQIRATFFVVGWVSERHPRLIEAGAGGRPRDRIARLSARARVRSRSRPVPRRSSREPAGARAAGAARVTMFRAPEWSINDRSLWALQTLVEEGVTVDASMAPVRIVGAVTYPRYPHLRQTPRRADNRGAAARRRSVRPGDADGLGLGPADELAAPGASHD